MVSVGLVLGATAPITPNGEYSNSTIPPSPVVDLDTVGTFNWVVTYSGDDQNESASSDCGSETVNVEPADPTITTEIFNAADDTVIPPGSVVLGVPGKVVKQTSDQQRAQIRQNAATYVELARRYR